jgi:hypothetical protein
MKKTLTLTLICIALAGASYAKLKNFVPLTAAQLEALMPPLPPTNAVHHAHAMLAGGMFSPRFKPMSYTYTLLSLTNGAQPNLQWYDSNHLIANMCPSNYCYLESTTNLLSPWTCLGPCSNGCICQIDTNQLQDFFRLHLIETRHFVTFLQAPTGDWPDSAIVVPEWSVKQGAWYMITNTQLSYLVYSNSMIYVHYPSVVTNIEWGFPIATVTEVYDTSSGMDIHTNVAFMHPRRQEEGFEPGYIIQNR